DIRWVRCATGRLTSIPFCIIGAATMKMMSRTSMTSTSGITLISDREVDTRRPCLLRPAASGMGITFGTVRLAQILPSRPAFPFASGEVALGDVQELEREVVHLRRVGLHLRRQVVVEIDSRDG